MGEPAMPTPKDRAETRKTARAIVDSVVDDEAMPLPFTWPSTPVDCPDCPVTDAEELIFALAQEITLLEATAPESRVLDTGEGRVLVGFTLHELRTILNHVPQPAIRERCTNAIDLLDPEVAKEYR